LILANDLDYGVTSKLMGALEEVSKLLESYIYSMLHSGS